MKSKKENQFSVKYRLAAIFAVVAMVLCCSAQAQTNNTVFLLQQTPANGGSITPDIGVHEFESDTEVVLTATPEPGYQFVYWIGDVSDPTASRTVAYVDSAKIIIAVFERVAHQFLATIEYATSAPNEGTRPRYDYINAGQGGGGGGRRPGKWSWPSRPTIEWPEPQPVPVPGASEEEESEILVPAEEMALLVPGTEPVPEPATILLLSSAIPLLRRRKSRRNTSKK